MAKTVVTLSAGREVTISIDGFTRADWIALVTSSQTDYDEHLCKMVKGFTADDLAALPWADYRLIDNACGELLRKPVEKDPS